EARAHEAAVGEEERDVAVHAHRRDVDVRLLDLSAAEIGGEREAHARAIGVDHHLAPTGRCGHHRRNLLRAGQYGRERDRRLYLATDLAVLIGERVHVYVRIA